MIDHSAHAIAGSIRGARVLQKNAADGDMNLEQNACWPNYPTRR
jgi:hypothetical protein